MDKRLQQVWARWLRQGFEQFCLVPVCPSCGHRTSTLLQELCWLCEAELLPYEPPPGEGPKEGPGGLRWTHALWEYKGSGGQLVRRAKFAHASCAIGFIARGMLRELKRGALLGGILRGSWLVVPVPLSRRKKRRRGFNQAEELAQHLARRMGWDLAANTLCRIRDTPALGQVKKTERETLLRGAFSLRRFKAVEVQGRRILLLDDVITTGATMRACASTLLGAGATRVLGLAACGARAE